MRLAACVATALLLAACGKERRVEENASAPATCTRCHGGGDNATGAPPLDGRGQSDTSVRSVGAHTAHVGGGRVMAPLGCEACHVAPGPGAPLAHVDGETRVALGIAARANGYAAEWDAGTASCDVYCHGPTLSGGSTPRPVWTVVRSKGSPPDCGACHGAPPPLPHPQLEDCGLCHAGTIRPGTEREIDLARGLHLNGVVEAPQGCTGCHGDPARAREPAAPPRGTHGETLPSERGVGAHQAHLTGGAIARAIACAECHLVPQSMTHADGVVDLAFGPTARARGAAPRFDAASGTCASTYCHGATLSPGGTTRTPSWTGGPAQAACGACHGAPPPSHGPAATRCELCHPGTVLSGGGIDVNGGLHVNGRIDVDRLHPDGWFSPTVHGLAANRDLNGCRQCHGADLGGGLSRIACALCHGAEWQRSCTFCHGDPNRATNAAAPPEGTQNELATTEPGVGAHQAHLRDGRIRQAVGCAECHAVPEDLSHVTGTPELEWGTLARTDGAAPRFEGGRCAATYCHGATLSAGGTNQSPAWTVVDGTEAACGTCHGNPPPQPHPQIATCRPCHPQTIAETGAIDVAGGTHVNGKVDRSSYHPLEWIEPAQHGYAANRDLASCRNCHGADLGGGTSGLSCDACHQPGWRTSCTFCHGDAARAVGPAAPPVGTQGQASTTDRAVGAHVRHVLGGALAPPIACAECHAVPADLAHVNKTPALTWGAVARSGSVAASFDGTTCTNYCHGASLAAGGSNTTPAWTVVNGTQAACGTCHGAPPPLPHPQNPSCGNCHPDAGVNAPNPATHVNGTLDLSALGCSACHGDSTRAVAPAAPPVGTRGETATTARAVGAHQPHVQGSALARPFDCDECHLKPSDLTHIDGAPAIVFGALSGASAVWNGASTTCTTYCHGATLQAGGSNVAPSWTSVGTGQAACGTCHGAPPPAPHPANTNCSSCHAGYTQSSVNLETHVDGKLDLSGTLSCSSCHGDPARAVAPAAPPFGTGGETSTNQRAVGAHQAHLAGSPSAAPVACGECHAVPSSPLHANGSVDLRFGAVATRSGSVAASFNGTTCTNYCHGASLAAGGTLTAPSWTAGSSQAACGTCHGAPPPLPHPQNTSCGNCHPGAGVNAPNPATHVNGTLDLSALGCSSCHGDATRAVAPAAPPVGTRGETATTARAVGAHQPHVQGSALARPFDCDECHLKPSDLTHIDGAPAIVFGALSGTSAVWNGTSTTCTTYCHGATLQAEGSNIEPSWTSVGTGEAACGSCHGRPPPAPHPANTNCSACHAGYTQNSVNLETHVDGKLDIAGTLSCSSCHGDPARAVAPAAPPFGTGGETSTNQRAVGAHQAHLTGTSLAAPVACTECHAVPSSSSHANGAVELSFGVLATKRGTVPASFNGTTTTCSNYCHGASLDGGSVTAPLWTGGSSQAVCGACHGLPPPSPHPAVSSDPSGCATCHDKTVNASGAIIPAATGGKHLNGAVDGGCVGCHPLPANASYWHSGSHGGTSAGTNSCQLCHEDAVGLTSPGGVVTDVTLSTATNCGPLRNQPCAASHNDGVVTLTPVWSNFCFNCHGGE